jgi:hypothetical protein
MDDEVAGCRWATLARLDSSRKGCPGWPEEVR